MEITDILFEVNQNEKKECPHINLCNIDIRWWQLMWQTNEKMTKFSLIRHKNGGLSVIYKGKECKYCTHFRSRICTTSSISLIYSCLKGPLDKNKLMSCELESCLFAVCLQTG